MSFYNVNHYIVLIESGCFILYYMFMLVLQLKSKFVACNALLVPFLFSFHILITFSYMHMGRHRASVVLLPCTVYSPSLDLWARAPSSTCVSKRTHAPIRSCNPVEGYKHKCFLSSTFI